MFRERLVRWAAIRDALSTNVGAILAGAAIWRHVGFKLGRGWESAARQRDFEVRLNAQRALYEVQGRPRVMR